jgi:hypothetical protein
MFTEYATTTHSQEKLMAKYDEQGYRKVVATSLPREEQARLRSLLRQELTEALVKTIRAEPPEVDLSQVELVLRPGQEVADWDVVAECSTCSTCGTCGTCSTCGTAALPNELPIGIARELGLAVSKPQIDARNLQRSLEQLNNRLGTIIRDDAG